MLFKLISAWNLFYYKHNLLFSFLTQTGLGDTKIVKVWSDHVILGLDYTPCSELLLTTMWGPWQLRGEVLHLLLLLVGLGSNRATTRQPCLCGPQGSQFCLIYEKIRSTVFQVVKLCQLMSNATVNDAYVYHYRMRPDPRGFQSCRNSGPKHAGACQLL